MIVCSKDMWFIVNHKSNVSRNDLVGELDRRYTKMNSTEENLTFVIEKGA